MSQADLEALRAVLLSIDEIDVDEPDMPVAVVLQEAHDLNALLRDERVRARLVSVGLAQADVDGLPAAEGALRAAQSAWAVSRDRSKSDAQKDREARGAALRAELVAACRWNLRDDRRAQAVLSVVQGGEGVADLVQDLEDLAALLTQHVPSFEADQSFDAPAQAEAARGLAAEIRAGVSQSRDASAQQGAKSLRDRAFTHLDDLSARVREAGRYAFRGEPATAARFTSAYKRRKRRRAAGGAEPAPAPAPPSA